MPVSSAFGAVVIHLPLRVDGLVNSYCEFVSQSLTYDIAGNLTADASGCQYEYDYENRIIFIEDSGDF